MKLNEGTRIYWSEEDILELEKVETFSSMCAVALRVLARMPRPISMVCGPMTTGGAGSRFENMLIFNEAIILLQAKGVNVFDQMPYEYPMERLKTGRPEGGYHTEILTDFYLPIFESGIISKFYFLPGWESSVGATWEHEQAMRLCAEIEYLQQESRSV